MSKSPRAVVREIGGQLVLDDPDALALIQVVEKNNCKTTFNIHIERIEHFKSRVKALNLSGQDVVIIIANVDDHNGGPIANVLMPGYNWQAIRDNQEVPFARGIAKRDGIQGYLEMFDNHASEKLRCMTELAVVVIDHGVAEIFPA